jgi:FkbM family methyltransferase
MAAEDPSTRRNRWQHHFDHLAGPHAHRLVLFGAAHFGKLILERLRTLAIEPCCFADNNPALWGTEVHGLEVLSPAGAVARFGHSAAFVVTIFNGSAARAQLRTLGCPSVIPAPILFWKYPSALMPNIGIDAPDRLAEQAAQIRHCYTLLADESSRQEFCTQVEWRYSMTPEFLPLPPNPGELYFPADIITDNPNEVFVDGGAFDGDSMRAFTRRAQPFQHFYALEPDRANIAALRQSLQHLSPSLQEKVTIWPYALSDKDGQISFVETHDMASSISTANEAISIEARKLDSLPWHLNPTYIKMDIEGSEPSALAGAAQLIRHHMPVLAICLYHRAEHLWQIPNLIHSLAPGYSLHIRRYAEDCWEEVCYAIPPNRLKQHSLNHPTRQPVYSSASN